VDVCFGLLCDLAAVTLLTAINAVLSAYCLAYSALLLFTCDLFRGRVFVLYPHPEYVHCLVVCGVVDFGWTRYRPVFPLPGVALLACGSGGIRSWAFISAVAVVCDVYSALFHILVRRVSQPAFVLLTRCVCVLDSFGRVC